MTEISPDQCGTELKRILELSLECTIRLDELLHDEYGALETQDMSALGAITTSKELCVRSLNSLESERQTLCTAAGYDASGKGMQALLQWCDRRSIITPVWERLLQLAKQCDAFNRTNGAIGRIRFEHVISALAVLKGGGSGTLYSAEGQETEHFEQRSLALV